MRNDGELTIGTKIDTKTFDAQIEEIWQRLEDIDTIMNEPGDGEQKKNFVKLNAEAEKLRNKLKDLVEKKDELENPPDELSQWSEDFGTSLSKNIKKISKLVLGIFGIRGAYMAVRNAMNVISENDAQLKADIDYIKSALAFALEPVVRRIVELAKNLLYFIGAIIKVWTGVNIFENANKSLSGANKQAKDLKKQLAGFDEMNVLSDTSGGAGGGDVGPSFDLGNLDEWVAKVEEIEAKWKGFGDTIKSLLDDTTVGEWIDAFGYFGLAIRGVVEIAYGLWEVIDGFVELVKGVVNLIVALVTGDTEKMKEAVIQILNGLWEMIDGLIHIIWGTIQAVIFGIVGLIMTCVETTANILTEIRKWISDNIIMPIANFFKGLWNGMVDALARGIELAKTKFNLFVTFLSGVASSILGFFKSIGTKVGEVVGGAFKGVINGVLGAIESILNSPIRAINKLVDVINKVPGVNLGKLSTFSLPRLAKGGIINMPGRGVPIGGATVGERGAEGVIPLTDSQQMALLGEAIGKYININATVPVYVGNRQIAREIKKIEAENDFAYNG